MNTKQLKWVFLVLLSLIWGSSFVLIKRGLISLTPIQLGSFRIIFAAVFLLLIGFKSLKEIPLEKWKYIAVTAFFGTFMPAYLFAIAETKIDSGVTAILNSLTPLNTMILGSVLFGISFRKNQITGVLVGFFGSVLLIFSGADNQHNQNYLYIILILTASVCYATNVNLIKRYLPDMGSLSITTGNFTVLLFPAILILSFSGFSGMVYSPVMRESLLYIMLLGVVGTGIANIIFFRLIQISSPVFATSVTYLIPIVACFWGLRDHEILTNFQLLGAFIILIGVYLSARK
jgi:drug/metabolite transporter (DMT)-like permease